MTTTTSTPNKIVVLLDESGSMFDTRADIIGSVNSFIESQKKLDEKSNDTLSLIKFSTTVRPVFTDRLIREATSISGQDYFPNGNTALYDAIGKVLSDYSSHKDVLLVIVTDGLENSSVEYAGEKGRLSIKNSLGELEKSKNWKVIYLSSDLQALRQGETLGFHQTSTNCVNVGSANVCVKSNSELGTALASCDANVAKFRCTKTIGGMSSNIQ
jgi:hypothetical protein